MKINKIVLSNIGAYLGHYEIDLSIPSPKRNVILFGGENGAGKTTLLDSIRLSLFGSYTYGFKTENDNYIKRVRSLLNQTAVKNNEKNYRIILEFSRVEGYVRSTYTLKRTWILDENNIKEQFEVIKDGQYLSEREKEIFQSKLREESPPDLFELCLFDGEEISRIISDNKLSDYIKHSARVLFNLDLFENLEQDIAQYIKYASAQESKSEVEQQLFPLEEEMEMFKNNYEQLVRKRESSLNNLTYKQNQLSQSKTQFNVHGGLVKEERDRLIAELNDIEQKRKLNIERVRSFITGLLPIYLVKEQLLQVQEQMHLEQENETHEYIKNSVKPEQLAPLVDSIRSLGLSIDQGRSIENILLDGILKSIAPKGINLIHRASFNQRSEIEALALRLQKINANVYIDLLVENNKLLKEAQILRKKIEENDKNTDFKDLLNSIQQLSQEIEKEKQAIDNLDLELEAIHEKIDQANQTIERLKLKIINSSKSDTTLTLSVKVTEVSKKFRMMQLQKKLQQVEQEATRMINQLIRKEDFLQKITINPNSFEVTLLSPQKEEIDQKTISAGEKELLLLSIIWAMFTTSGRRMPFVFDTLLGRLDKTHKERLLTKLIPICGEQVIILSTDSEIDNNNFELIKPYLEKTYTLEYDKEHRKVNLEKDKYFNFNGMELKM
jgi:DNA sulfur modification protein DndD